MNEITNRSKAQEILASFDALDEDLRAAFERNIATTTADELADQLREAGQVLEGFCVASETLSFFTYMVVSDCRERVREAARRAGVE